MNIIVNYIGLTPIAAWQNLAEENLRKLQTFGKVTSARATFACAPNTNPAFRVMVVVKGSGPDFYAEVSDHTIKNALINASNDLERQMLSLGTNGAARGKSEAQLGLSPVRLAARFFSSRT